MKFEAELKDVLEQMVCKKADSIIMVDDLANKLQEKFPGVKGFERRNILRSVSLLYGKKIEYMGKKKRYNIRQHTICVSACIKLMYMYVTCISLHNLW